MQRTRPLCLRQASPSLRLQFHPWSLWIFRVPTAAAVAWAVRFALAASAHLHPGLLQRLRKSAPWCRPLFLHHGSSVQWLHLGPPTWLVSGPPPGSSCSGLHPGSSHQPHNPGSVACSLSLLPAPCLPLIYLLSPNCHGSVIFWFRTMFLFAFVPSFVYLFVNFSTPLSLMFAWLFKSCVVPLLVVRYC